MSIDEASAADAFSRVDWNHYHDYTEIVDILFWLNETYLGVVDVFSIGKSYLGRDIYCVRLTNETCNQLKTKVLFVGYHHATERISAELPLHFVVDTATSWGTNQTVNRLLNFSEIFVVVALNVDGFEAVEQNEWQRKNLRPYDEDNDGLIDEDPPDDADNDGYIEDLVTWTSNGWEFVRWEGIDDDGDGRFNEDWTGGVDLNRNYGYQWNATVDFSGPNPEDGDYRGPTAFSEPETQAMRDFTLGHNFTYALSFHSGGEWITRPWMYTLTRTSDDSVLREVAGNISRIVGIPFPLAGNRSTVSGTWDDWMYGNCGTLPLTCEIYTNQSALQYTYSGQGSEYWERGISQFFNPDPAKIEVVLNRWLPALTYLVNRAVGELLVSIDTEAPNITSIVQVPPDGSVLPENEVEISVTVSDNLSGVKQVTLTYTHSNASGNWTRIVQMIKLEGDVWSAVIPAFATGTIVSYRITAEDSAGNIVSSDDFEYELRNQSFPELSSLIFLLAFVIAALLAVTVYKLLKDKKRQEPRGNV